MARRPHVLVHNIRVPGTTGLCFAGLGAHKGRRNMEGQGSSQDADEAVFVLCMGRASEAADRESGDRFLGGARWLRRFARSLFDQAMDDVAMPRPTATLEEWRRRRKGVE